LAECPLTTQSGHFLLVDLGMDIIAELLILGFFYITGSLLTTVLSIGKIKPELVNWKIRKNWDFGTITHIDNNKRYLDWEWVIIFGAVFWIILAFYLYYR